MRSAACGQAQATCRSAAYVTHAPYTEHGGASEAGSTGTMYAAVTFPCARVCTAATHISISCKVLDWLSSLTSGSYDANLRQTLRTYSISLKAHTGNLNSPRKGPFVSGKRPLSFCFCQSYEQEERTPGSGLLGFQSTPSPAPDASHSPTL